MDARAEASPAVVGRSKPAGWQERPLVAAVLISFLATLLVLRCGYGPTVLHDSLSIYWVWADQFTAELAKGHLFPRWLPDSNAGLGAPVFYYYPPLAFYVAGLFGLAGLTTYASLLATFWLAFAGSGFACWCWLRGRSTHPLLGAMFFMAAPYHLYNYVDRGALAESVAIALIPVLAIGLRRISEGRGGLIIAAVGYAAMIGTHLPLALLTGVFLIAPYALWHRQRMGRFVAATALGVTAAAITILPALMLSCFHDEGQLYRSANLRTDYWNLFAGHWSDPNFTLTFAIVAATVLAAAGLATRRDRWALLAIATLLVVAGLVPFFWSLPVLAKVQFPFRALPIAEFALATALARSVIVPRAAALPLIVSVAILPGVYNAPRDMGRLRAVHPDAYEYLPKGVLGPNQLNAKLSDVTATRIPPPRVTGMVVEPHFYFPAWSCGTEEPSTQLLMHVPDCRPQIVWTMAEKLGAALSTLAALFLMLLAWRARVARPSNGPIPAGPSLLAQANRTEREPVSEHRASDRARGA